VGRWQAAGAAPTWSVTLQCFDQAEFAGYPPSDGLSGCAVGCSRKRFGDAFRGPYSDLDEVAQAARRSTISAQLSPAPTGGAIDVSLDIAGARPGQ